MNQIDFKILVVEDNILNRKVMVQKLLKNNYRTEEAENGLIALEKVKSWKPDLILLDVMMPELDGFKVLEILRETLSQVELPVILVTAMQDSEDIVKGFKLGANDYLPKNFNTEELLARVSTGLIISSYHKLLKIRNNTIERELDIARLIQKKILPIETPKLEGYQIGSLYVPMDKVGGDYFDYFVSDSYCDFLMADVSGHGVPGALIASILKMSAQFLHLSDHPLKDIMKSMDQAVSERGAMGMFATALLMRLHPKEAKIIYSNAGHHPLLIHRRTTDTFIELSTPGAPLGINYDFKKHEYIEGEFQLIKGDRIILFTDGIIEAVNEKDVDFETAIWKNFLIENKGSAIPELSERLIKTLRVFSNKETFGDDLTWVVVDYSGN